MRSGNNIKLGSLLRSIAQEAGELSSKETEQFNQLRDRTAAEPMRFEALRVTVINPWKVRAV